MIFFHCVTCSMQNIWQPCPVCVCVFAQMWSIVLIKYLQVQNVVISPAIVTFGTFVMNIGLNFGFIAAFGFRVRYRDYRMTLP